MKNKKLLEYLFKGKLFVWLAFVVPIACHGATPTSKDEDKNLSCGSICQSVRHIFIIQNNDTEINFDPIKDVVRNVISRKINIVGKIPTDGRPEPFNLHSGMTKRKNRNDEQYKFSVSPKQVHFILDFHHDECNKLDIKIDVKLLSANAFYLKTFNCPAKDQLVCVSDTLNKVANEVLGSYLFTVLEPTLY